MPQRMHFSGSMTAMFSMTLTASAGQFFSQSLHAMHELLQAVLASFPIYLLLHFGCIFAAGCIRSIKPCGHAFTQSPQPTHLFSSTAGVPPSSRLIAFRRQAETHDPPPRQPYIHAAIPSGYSAFIASLQVRRLLWTSLCLILSYSLQICLSGLRHRI